MYIRRAYTQEMGRGQAVMHNSKTGTNYAASDPRADGAAVPEPILKWSPEGCRSSHCEFTDLIGPLRGQIFRKPDGDIGPFNLAIAGLLVRRMCLAIPPQRSGQPRACADHLSIRCPARRHGVPGDRQRDHRQAPMRLIEHCRPIEPRRGRRRGQKNPSARVYCVGRQFHTGQRRALRQPDLLFPLGKRIDTCISLSCFSNAGSPVSRRSWTNCFRSCGILPDSSC